MNHPSHTPPAVLERTELFWKVLATAHGLEGRLEAALEEIGLSMAKAGLLRCLAESGESMVLSDVAEHTKCVRSNITQLMDRLEADGLVRRIADADDRRIRRADLTEAGREAYEKAARIVESHERELAQTLSPEDAKLLDQMLGQLSS